MKNVLDEAKFKVIKEYAELLREKQLVQKSIIDENINLIKKFEINVILEEINTNGFNDIVKLTDDFYIDKLGYLDDSTFNNKFIEKLLTSSKNIENYHTLLIKEKCQKNILKEFNFNNIIEFDFILSFMNNLITKIGKIIHQGDNNFLILFNEISNSLNPKKYNLIKEKNKYKFVKNSENGQKYIGNLNINNYTLQNFEDFSNELLENNVKSLKKLLGENNVQDIIKECKSKIPKDELIKIDKKIYYISKKTKEFIVSYEKYKELMLLYPQLKNYINLFYENNMDLYDIQEIKEEFIDEKKENEIINYFLKIYLLIIYLRTKIENLIKNYKDSYDNYEKLLTKMQEYKIKEKILEYYEDLLKNEEIVKFIFESERDKLILEFEEKINAKKKEVINTKPEEVENYNKKIEVEKSIISKMKTINIEYINKTFKNYLEFDVTKYDDTKFDIVLYLYQNGYI